MTLQLRFVLPLLIISSLGTLHAQKKGYEPGYIVTLEGDTLRGQVKDRSSEPFVEMYPRIRFIPEGRSSRQKYRPGEILGYRAGSRVYESLPLWEDAAFFKFRYYLDPSVENVFVRLISRDGPLSYYLQEFIHDDNNFVDAFPLFHLEGEREMVRVTQGILGLKRERLKEYFGDCRALVEALENKELREVEEVYDFFLDQCLNYASPTEEIQTIKGNWQIDLRPSTDADPYLQDFEVTAVSGNTFQGYFYGSPLEDAKLNRNWEVLYFAFTTRDNTYEYYHSGYLLDGKLYGISYCPGREFVQPWEGVPK